MVVDLYIYKEIELIFFKYLQMNGCNLHFIGTKKPSQLGTLQCLRCDFFFFLQNQWLNDVWGLFAFLSTVKVFRRFLEVSPMQPALRPLTFISCVQPCSVGLSCAFTGQNRTRAVTQSSSRLLPRQPFTGPAVASPLPRSLRAVLFITKQQQRQKKTKISAHS